MGQGFERSWSPTPTPKVEEMVTRRSLSASPFPPPLLRRGRSRDHTAANRDEAERIVSLGGTILWDGGSGEGGGDPGNGNPTGGTGGGPRRGMARVNGELAVTRSLGDARLKRLLTAEPDVAFFQLATHRVVDNGTDADADGPSDRKADAGSAAAAAAAPFDFRFLVVATDGLWDVMTSAEAVEYVKARRSDDGDITSYARGRREGSGARGGQATGEATDQAERGDEGDARGRSAPSPRRAAPMSWQRVSQALTHEALLRGSLDNVGVCVVDLQRRSFDDSRQA